MVKRHAMRLHSRMQRLLPGMAERGMSDVVSQRQRFHQVDVQSKLGGDGACNLCDFNGMSEPVAKVIGVAAGGELGFVFRTSEGGRRAGEAGGPAGNSCGKRAVVRGATSAGRVVP